MTLSMFFLMFLYTLNSIGTKLDYDILRYFLTKEKVIVHLMVFCMNHVA